MRSLSFLRLTAFTLVLMAVGAVVLTGEVMGESAVVPANETVPVKEDDANESDSFLGVQIVIAVVLASLLYVRRDTGYENPFNKVLKIFLYGTSILLLLSSIIILILAGIFMDAFDVEGRNPGWMWLLFAILFALTGSFLGHESYSYPSSRLGQSSTSSSIPSSKPIFANRPAAPRFKAENETTTIECPGCSAQMQVPKLGTMQTVTCKSCGLSGEIEI